MKADQIEVPYRVNDSLVIGHEDHMVATCEGCGVELYYGPVQHGSSPNEYIHPHFVLDCLKEINDRITP